jgi:hypothetical protein
LSGAHGPGAPRGAQLRARRRGRPDAHRDAHYRRHRKQATGTPPPSATSSTA